LNFTVEADGKEEMDEREKRELSRQNLFTYENCILGWL
jgi:hypothetical protein